MIVILNWAKPTFSNWKNQNNIFFFFFKILFVYLLRLAMLIWRSGQRLERAVAVDPRTQLVPPSTKTRAFLDLYGSWTLYSLSWVAQANANPVVLFKCNKARAITINGLTNLLLNLMNNSNSLGIKFAYARLCRIHVKFKP